MKRFLHEYVSRLPVATGMASIIQLNPEKRLHGVAFTQQEINMLLRDAIKVGQVYIGIRCEEYIG